MRSQEDAELDAIRQRRMAQMMGAAGGKVTGR